ncbi:VOC family protein [Spirillospora sp. NPDC047279]|uniref:VOC family protein n=1 Tax=Spirillospora sp. NPDC047279 TaxID=3155478 RepID=UPI0033E646E7
MLRGFSTLNFWVDDVEAAASWYAEFLGIEPYFNRSGPDGRPAYIEFRTGDRLAELGFIDRRFGPPGAGEGGPTGGVMHWHVDDVEAAFARLLALGATEYQPVTEHGPGFVTASVTDPFGNVLGVMFNQHYLDMLAS